MTFSGAMIFMRQRHSKKLPLIPRKFSMQSMHWWTSMWSYRHADISQKTKNPNCMLYFTNMNIYSMALWEHGIINPIILNLRKVLSRIIADLSLFQKLNEHTLKVELVMVMHWHFWHSCVTCDIKQNSQKTEYKRHFSQTYHSPQL